jgi:hypothetical protein
MSADPYALLEDGSAADPAAFREALRADPAKMEALEAEPEVAKVVLGDDVDAFQELIKSVSQVRCARRREVERARVSRRAASLSILGAPRARSARVRTARTRFSRSRPRRPSTDVRPPARAQAERRRQERLSKGMAERTIDAQRVSATVPRDTVQLYAQLRESGLQYGPAFRLLRNVHVPDVDAGAGA